MNLITHDRHGLTATGDTLTVPCLSGSCPHCSGNSTLVWHQGICPKIKALDYFPDGSVKHIEFR